MFKRFLLSAVFLIGLTSIGLSNDDGTLPFNAVNVTTVGPQGERIKISLAPYTSNSSGFAESSPCTRGVHQLRGGTVSVNNTVYRITGLCYQSSTNLLDVLATGSGRRIKLSGKVQVVSRSQISLSGVNFQLN